MRGAKLFSIGEEKAMFQLRSSQACFLRFKRFVSHGKSISCLLSIPSHNSTPPASTETIYYQHVMDIFATV